jgi:GAF domain-containing protein
MLATREGVQVLVGDPTADLGDLSLLGRGPYGSMLIAPAIALGETVGLLVAFGRDERPWSRAETSRALIVAAQLGSLLATVPGLAELAAQPAA